MGITMTSEKSNEIAKQVLLRQSHMADAREPFEADWLEIAKYMIPSLEFMNEPENIGQRPGTNIFDSTPGSFLEMEAAGLQSHTTSATIKWFKFIASNPKHMKSRRVREWLQAMDEHFYYLFQSRSNYYQRVPSFFKPYVALAFSSMFIDENPGTGEIIFHIPNPWEIFVEKDANGKRDTVHRVFPMTARNMIATFEKADLSDPVITAAESNLDKSFNLIHAVYPNADKDFYKTGAQDKVYTGIFMEEGKSPEKKLLRLKGKNNPLDGYNTMPYITAAWTDVPNTAYSYGPAHMALPDTLMLNDGAEKYWTAAQKLVEPPMWLPAKYQMQGFSTAPNARNWYEEEAILDAKPIITTIDLDKLLDGIHDKRAQISSHFMADLFLMLTRAENQPKTAYEIREKKAEQTAELDPVVSSLNTTFGMMFDRLIQLEYDAHRLPTPPPEILDRRGGYDIDYIGPLAQAAKRMFETQGKRAFLEENQEVFDRVPSSMDNVDWDKWIQSSAESTGVNLGVIREEKAVEEIRAVRVEDQEAQRQADQMVAMGKATKDMGAPIDEKSLLGKMGGDQQAPQK